MNRPALLLAAVLVMAAPAPAPAYELVVNGGFETASLSGWTPFSQGASGGTGGWYAKTGSGNGTYSGLPTSPPPAGSWEAVADNSGRFAAILYQDVFIPPTIKATLSFTIWHGNAASGNTWTNGTSLSPSITNQRVRVDIVPTSQGNLITSGALAVVYQTGTGTAQIVNPTPITFDMTPFAGQTVRLRFALVATQGGLIAGIDKVSLDVSPFVLQAAALPGLFNGDARWGDFDGDGIYDIAMTGDTGAGRTTTIQHWNGTTWQGMVTLPGAQRGLAVGDVNADGRLDLGMQGIDFGAGAHVGVYRGLGGFDFDPLLELEGVPQGTIAWSDFDRDGDLDALLTGSSFGTPFTYIGRNDGTGHLSLWIPGVRGVLDGDAIWANVLQGGLRDIVATGSGATDFSADDGAGNYTTGLSSFIDMAGSRVAMGDLSNDGKDEMVVVGRKISDGTRASKIYGFGPFGWIESGSGLVGVDDGDVALGDFDDDGWMDIALMGDTGGGYVTRVYHNNANGTFTDMNVSLPGMHAGAIRCADFDGDGDLDLLVVGRDFLGPRAFLALNQWPGSNSAPAAPANLFAQLAETEIALQIGFFGFDDHVDGTVLTHNFRAGTGPGLADLIPPMSDLTTGRRMIPEPGGAGHAPVARLLIDRIGHNGSVYWDAQNVDPCYLGSGWAGEQRFVIGPAITSVADIPNDQGGHVRLTLTASPLDDAARSTWPVAGYDVWRLVPPSGRVAQSVMREGASLRALERPAGVQQAVESLRGVGGLSLVEWDGRTFVRSTERSIANPFPTGTTWEIVGSFFATQASSYVIAATTLADSGASGLNDQTFMVTVHTTTPSVWFASAPVSGHSVDNIAPAPPTGLAAAYHTGSGNQLTWQPAPETDFESFRIYRGTTSNFVASPANLIASTPSPTWTDPTYDSPVVFYKVSTTDHAGNESAAVAPGSTTAVGGSGGLTPLVFALGAPSPNPFGVETALSFTLPHGAATRLEVFDASGRRVRTLVDGWQPAGAHSVRWDGSGDEGARLGAGVYFARLEAGAQRATRRVALMK